MRRRRHHDRLIVLIICVAVLAAAWQPLYRNVFLKAAYPRKYQSIVASCAAKSGLDPSLVYAVIRSESGFDPNAKSNIGALGLMQLTPPTFDWAMTKTHEDEHYTADDLYTPEINVRYGTVVLSELLNEFGDEQTAIAAYHAGRSNVKAWLSNPSYSKDGRTLYHIPFTDTRVYVKKVEATKKIYSELYGTG